MKRLFDPCRDFERKHSAYLDGRLSGDTATKVRLHLDVCPQCGDRHKSLSGLRASLRTLPPVQPPAHLELRLRVLASRDLSRRREQVGFWQHLRNRTRVWTDTLMRPVALPAAGGVLSALLLFGIIAPVLSARGVNHGHLDVPTVLYTEPSVKMTGPGVAFEFEDLEVEAVIDEQGRMVDYSVADPENLRLDSSTRRAIENSLIMTEFTPATAFGQKVPSRLKLRLRASSSIDVKG